MIEEQKTEPTVEVVRTPGETLRQAREKYGLSEEDVAVELNLSARQVRALEENRFQELPGETYIRGYLKSYAKLVDTDEKDILQNFSRQENAAITGIRPVIKETRSSDRHMKLLTLGVVVVLGGLMFLWWQNREQSFIPLITLEAEPEQPKAAAQQPAEPEPSASDAAPYEVERTEPVPRVYGSASPEGGEPAVAEGSEESAADYETVATVVERTLQNEGRAEPDGTNRTGSATEAVAAAPQAAPARAEAVRPANTTQQAAVNTAGAASSASRAQTSRQAPKPEPGREVKLSFTATSWVDLRDADGQRLIYENINGGREISVQGKPPFSVFLGNAEGVRVEYSGEPFDFRPFTNGIYARFKLGAGSPDQSN